MGVDLRECQKLKKVLTLGSIEEGGDNTHGCGAQRDKRAKGKGGRQGLQKECRREELRFLRGRRPNKRKTGGTRLSSCIIIEGGEKESIRNEVAAMFYRRSKKRRGWG